MLMREPSARPTAEQLLTRVTAYDLSAFSRFTLFGDCCRNIFISKTAHETDGNMYKAEIQGLRSTLESTRASLEKEQQKNATLVSIREATHARLVVEQASHACEDENDPNVKQEQVRNLRVEVQSLRAEVLQVKDDSKNKRISLIRMHEEEKEAILRQNEDRMDTVTRGSDRARAAYKSAAHHIGVLERQMVSKKLEPPPIATYVPRRPLRTVSDTDVAQETATKSERENLWATSDYQSNTDLDYEHSMAEIKRIHSAHLNEQVANKAKQILPSSIIDAGDKSRFTDDTALLGATLYEPEDATLAAEPLARDNIERIAALEQQRLLQQERQRAERLDRVVRPLHDPRTRVEPDDVYDPVSNEAKRRVSQETSDNGKNTSVASRTPDSGPAKRDLTSWWRQFSKRPAKKDVDKDKRSERETPDEPGKIWTV